MRLRALPLRDLHMNGDQALAHLATLERLVKAGDVLIHANPSGQVLVILRRHGTQPPFPAAGDDTLEGALVAALELEKP